MTSKFKWFRELFSCSTLMATTLSIAAGQKAKFFAVRTLSWSVCWELDKNPATSVFLLTSPHRLEWPGGRFWPGFDDLRLGTNRGGTWDNWITKEKTWNVGCLQKYMRFFDRLSFVWYYLVQHMYRPLWGLAHLINGKYSTNRQLVSGGRFWWILLISSPLNRNLSHLALREDKKSCFKYCQKFNAK